MLRSRVMCWTIMQKRSRRKSWQTIGKVWYIPHHGMYHPAKQKLWVVFDCAASYKGVSLNSKLRQGPDLANSLVGVILRFRKEPIGITADIKSIFHQVRVRKSDVNYLRFLWWTQGEISQTPKEYRMLVHIFGAMSSPSCANFALQKTADDNESSVQTFQLTQWVSNSREGLAPGTRRRK